MDVPHWPHLVKRAARENWLLKLICSVAAAWLIYDELRIFFINRPTSNSDEITRIGSEIFPNILICPMVPLDMPKLASKGYLHYFGYYLGLDLPQTTFIGWGGVDQEEPTALLDSLSMMNEAQWATATLDAFFFTSGDYSKIQTQLQVVTKVLPKVQLAPSLHLCVCFGIFLGIDATVRTR